MPPSLPQRTLLTKSFLLALVLFLTLELCVRVFWSQNMSGRFEYGYHPTAGFVENGNGTVELVRAGGRRFRPQSFAMPKPEGVYRIFTIGDSVPRGPSLEKAYPYQLQEMLKARGIPTESLNLAVAGYGARRSQIVFKQILKYRPDLVILHLNDSNEYEDEREHRRAKEFASWHPKNWLMKSLVLRRLYELKTEKIFWKWLPAEIRAQKGVNDADAEIAAMRDEATRERWRKRVETVTRETIQLALDANVSVLILIQAVMEEGAEHPNDKGLDAFARSLEQTGVTVVSMKETFAGDEKVREDYSDGSHLRASGHEKIASALAEKITTAEGGRL